MQELPTRSPTSPPPLRGLPDPAEGGLSPKPKLKKLRLLVILSGLGGLALVSTVFGMMMAVSSDLPDLENRAEFQRSRNSIVFAEPTRKGELPPPLAKLTNNQNRILVQSSEISPNIKNAVVAIEDRRFYEHDGVDYKGIGRALVEDVRQQRAAQGGSTITQQFVKNALAAQSDRSVFQKLRESALAYHLERKWSKQKVLTQYLNSVYFGNGAYGVEAAVRTYFGSEIPGSAGDIRARAVSPAQAALLAGMIASPSLFDPLQNPARAQRRRDAVLDRMRDQGMISPAKHRESLAASLPTDNDVSAPQPDSRQPYFTSWLTQQLVDRYKAPAVFTGGLRVKTTLDPELQAAAEQAIAGRLAGVGPSASLAVIENRTGEVKAMVGGTDFKKRPFNIATNGHRQPGSSFKPFTLIRALQDGVSPEATFTSQKKTFPVPGGGPERFVVNNYEDSYAGVSSLRAATIRSDNSVFAELGLRVGTRRIATLAQQMGIRTRVSSNPAMTLGGLKEGLTPLELAYAYSTIANKGVRVSGTLDTTGAGAGPVAIERVENGDRIVGQNEVVRKRVFPEAVGETVHQILAGVVTSGTGKTAQIGEFAAGKTGTTEEYGDAWFAGFNKELTVAVWVGYPDELRFMRTEYGGKPVAGGTYPAEIWRDFMRAWISVRDRREAESGRGDDKDDEALPAVPAAPVAPQPETTTPSDTRGEFEVPEPARRERQPPPAPEPVTPAEEVTPAPSPAPQLPVVPGPPPSGGGTGGGGAAPAPAPAPRLPVPRAPTPR